MTWYRSIPTLPLLATTIGLLALPGCGDESALSPGPDPALHAAAPLPGEPIEGEYMALLDAKADVKVILKKYDLVQLDLVEDLDLLLFSSPTKSLEDIRSHRDFKKDFDAAEQNEVANLSDPINLIVSFVEFDWTEEDYPAQDELACLHLPETHEHASGKSTRIAAIDTGVDIKHPHLADRLEIIDDPVLGLPYENSYSGQPTGYPAFGHGTHVAGVIATVAPQATIVPFRALNNLGTGTDFTVAAALWGAFKADVDIINLSLRLGEDSDVIEQMLQKIHAAGIVVFAGSGNDTPGFEAVYPASSDYTISVAATRTDASGSCTSLANFSARGKWNVDFAGSGVGVASSVPGAALGDVWVKRATGTSVSCAVASASYALMIGQLDSVKPPRNPMRQLELYAPEVQPVESVAYGLVSAYHALGIDRLD